MSDFVKLRLKLRKHYDDDSEEVFLDYLPYRLYLDKPELDDYIHPDCEPNIRVQVDPTACFTLYTENVKELIEYLQDFLNYSEIVAQKLRQSK